MKNNKFKKSSWVNGNKMLVNTGHKTFDKQTNILTYGNVSANTMSGYYIRAYNNTVNPVNQIVKPGYLQQWDLGNRNIPGNVQTYVKSVAIDYSVILYHLFHYNDDNKISHAWIVTTNYGELMNVIYDNYKQKTIDIVQECLPYFSYED